VDYTVTPVDKFFISAAHYEEGDAVDVSQVGATVSIDFTGTSHTVASTDFKVDGTYSTPTYSDS